MPCVGLELTPAPGNYGLSTVSLNGPALAAACATASLAPVSGNAVTAQWPRSSSPLRTRPIRPGMAAVSYIHCPRTVIRLRMIQG